MRARASRAVGPHKVGAYDNYTQYIRRPIFSGVVAMVCGPCGSAPQIFSAWKKCVKSSSHKFQGRRIPQVHLGMEYFYQLLGGSRVLRALGGRYTEPIIRKMRTYTVLYSLICVRTGAVLGGLHSFMCTFKQVGNSKTIGYTFGLFNNLHKTHCCAPYFAPPRLLRPGATAPLCPRSLRHWSWPWPQWP